MATFTKNGIKYTVPTKRILDGEAFYFHTAHPSLKEAKEMEAFLVRKHPRKYRGRTRITQDADGRWRLWAKKWW